MDKNLPSVLNYQDEKTLKVIKETVAKGTTESEFGMFLELCKSTGLNPFKKEIWCIVTGKDQYRTVQMMTGINGYYQIANSHPQFDGVEFKYGPEKTITLPTNSDGVKELSVYAWIEAQVFRKDRSRPQSYRMSWEEAATDPVTRNGRLSLWGKKPKYMHGKVVETHALKRAFSQELNGIYTEGEMPEEYNLVSQEVEALPDAHQTAPKEPVKPQEGSTGEKVYKVKTGNPEPVEEVVEDLAYSYNYDVSPLLNDPEKVDTFMDWYAKHCDDFIAMIKGDIVASVNPIKKLEQYKVEA